MLCTWWSFNLPNKLSYEILHINNVSTIWEGQYIEITLNVLNKKIILGNIYRPPHDTNDLTGFNRIAIHFPCVGSWMAPGQGSLWLI